MYSALLLLKVWLTVFRFFVAVTKFIIEIMSSNYATITPAHSAYRHRHSIDPNMDPICCY